MLEEAQRILLRSVGPAHSLVARNRAHQAELALRRGRTAAAVQLARDTLDDFDRLGMPDHPCGDRRARDARPCAVRDRQSRRGGSRA